MKMFKKSISALLSVLLIFSFLTATAVTASATDDVTVTVKSKQNAFSDVTKTYNKNETFELTLLWQNTNYLIGAQFETLLNNKGLKVIKEQTNPILPTLESNISEECQQQYGLVSALGSFIDGVDFTSQSYLIKYEVLVMDTASAEETITVDFHEMYGHKNPSDLGSTNDPAALISSFIFYISGHETIENNADQFSAGATLGDGVPVPTEEPTTESSTPGQSESSQPDDSQPSEPASSGTSEPTENPSQDNSDPSTPDNPQPSEPASSGTSEPTENPSQDNSDPSTPDDSQPTEPNTTEPVESEPTTVTEPTSAKPAPAVKVTLKASKINAGSRTRVTVANAKGKKITYSSSKKNIAKIDKSGIVTGLQKGKTTLKIKVGTKTYKKTLTVKTDPKLKNGKKTLKNKQVITVRKGKKTTLKITGKASAIKNKVSVSSKKIAKITSKTNQTKVVFKAMKKGSTTLTVKINGVKTYKFKIKVK